MKKRNGTKAPSTAATASESKTRITRDKRTKSAPSHRHGRYRKTVSLQGLLMFLLGFFGLVFGILYYFYQKYGMDLFMGHGMRDYKWSPHQWREFLDREEKTVLIVGGPHRSGTTIIWKGISQHPDIAGFGDRFETGADYSEGVLMQGEN